MNITSGNGKYSVQSSEPNVVSVAVEDNLLLVTAVGPGTTDIIVTDKSKKTATIEVTVIDYAPLCPDNHHPHMIDLGLPSGTKWACCNVGAKMPKGYGSYYAWGETDEKNVYTWDTYNHCDGTMETCHDIGLKIYGTPYDVAHVKWGGAWCIPTQEQIKELVDNCTWKYTNEYGVYGSLFTSLNGGAIFLPSAGYLDGCDNYGSDNLGYYWSSMGGQYKYASSSLKFDSNSLQSNIFTYTYYGLTVRPVYDLSYFFSLSEDVANLFVNSTKTVSIEKGSGEYELLNDNPDIIDAEVIKTNKEDNPNAKDEIIIYGIAEGTATLKVLDKQILDSITIDVNVKTPTNNDVAQTEDYISRIVNFMNQQGEITVADFKNSLRSWLEEQDWVDLVDIRTETISIVFINGAVFSILLVDDMLFNAGLANWDLPSYTQVDVSYKEGEDIIKSPNVLYIQGRTMPSFKEQTHSTANLENGLIQEANLKSPFKFNITPKFKELSFLERSFIDKNTGEEMKIEDYGMILLGQTHGYNDKHKGAFQVEDRLYYGGINRAITLFIDEEGEVIKLSNNPDNKNWVYIISPIAMENLKKSDDEKAIQPKTIFYACYCHSWGMQDNLSQTTFFGYNSSEWYQKSSYQMAEFFYNMSLGLIYEDAIEPMMTQLPPVLNSYNITPATNNRHSKQRYFSISTDDVTKYTQNGPVITGVINGYKNLKSDIEYYVYAFKGEELNKDNIVTKQLIDKSKIEEEDGNGAFSHEFTGLPFSEDSEEYQVVVGFEYKGITYYGPIKTLKTKELCSCPDDNHPHLIDLGLPSGTKWACCNVGASTPEDYGGYYAWGETEEKGRYEWSNYIHCDGTDYTCHDLGSDIAGTQYDVAHVRWGGSWVMPSLDQIHELLNNCTNKPTHINGVDGWTFIGPNGGSIFLPRAGYYWEGRVCYANKCGHYWSSTQDTSKAFYAYILFFHQSPPSRCGYHRFSGNSVRPVSR